MMGVGVFETDVIQRPNRLDEYVPGIGKVSAHRLWASGETE